MAPRLRSALWLWLSLISSLSIAASVPLAPGVAVDTSNGAVTGHAASAKPNVTEFLGIRYGEFTTGKNRFLPPKPWYGTVEAEEWGNPCPQSASAIVSMLPTLSKLPPNEDCLFLNLWIPPNTARGDKKAVMVWIHGGAFAAGESSTALYTGQFLAANEDVLVASLNYRLNIFGFPGAPFLPDQNLGLLDQRLAIEWLRTNVGGFGGDPERMTIFGESAGGSSVDYYAYAWTEDPIVNGFIAESGTAMMTGPFKPEEIETRSQAWYKMTEAVGCGGEESGEATLACTQEKTVEEIQKAMPIPEGFMSTAGFFGPTYDGKTVFKNVNERAVQGKFIRKPLLMGTNMNESLIFQSTMGPGEVAEADAVDNGFRCGTADACKARSMHVIPVWRYLYAGNKKGSNVGAAHGSEMPLVFLEPAPDSLGAVMQHAWATFAKDPAEGLSDLGWPMYEPEGNTLIRLGYEEAVEPEFVRSNMYDDACPTLIYGWFY